VADKRTILIAGAGIGGLTAALALADAGFQIIVCERAGDLSELGAGIQLSPNAGRVLAGLGLDEGIAREAVDPVAIDIRNGRSGRSIASIPTAKFRERYGFPYRVIHRADLQAVLAAAALLRPEITIRLGATVGGLVHQAGGYLAKIEHGGSNEVVAASAVIGADGVWSELRQRIPGASEPRATGRTAWRALIPVDNAPASLPADRVGLWLGEAAHLVTYPVARGSAINLVAIVEEEWTRPGWSAAGDGDWLAARFAAWSEPARAIVAAPFSWQKWPIVAVDPAGPWVEGPLALIGDAAHAMTPFFAQGGAMAIEDAAVLARCLAGGRDVEAALRAYEAERKPRVVHVAEAATRTGAIYHWRPPRSYFRDLALRIAGSRLIFWQNDWIYRWVMD
jgi:salicylate hydroxylase